MIAKPVLPEAAPPESARGLRGAVVFILPLLVIFALVVQVIDPALDRLFPRVNDALIYCGLETYRAALLTFLLDAVAGTVVMVAAAEIVRRHYALKPSETGWTRPTRWPLRVAAGLAAGIGLVFLWGIVKNLDGEIFFQRLPYIRMGTAPGWRAMRGAPDLGNLFGNWILAAPAEEIFFRGALYGALRRRLDRRAAVPLAALLFALAHFPWSGFRSFDAFQFCWLFFTGTTFAVLREWDGSLLTPIVAHSLLDFAFYSVGVRFLMT